MKALSVAGAQVQLSLSITFHSLSKVFSDSLAQPQCSSPGFNAKVYISTQSFLGHPVVARRQIKTGLRLASLEPAPVPSVLYLCQRGSQGNVTLLMAQGSLYESIMCKGLALDLVSFL